MKINLHELFIDLIWPAVAGSVAWSLITMALVERGGQSGEQMSFWMRILALVFVTYYLMVSWMRDKVDKQEGGKRGYYPLDGLFALSISVFAIAVCLNNSKDRIPVVWVDGSLAAIFFFAAIGHLCRIWQNPRPLLGWIELGCFVIALIQCVCPDHWRISVPDVLYRPVVLLIVIIAWFTVPDNAKTAKNAITPVPAPPAAKSP